MALPSVIPGKIDPNYQGDLRYAKPIPGTAFTITPDVQPEPIITVSQPFQPEYYQPGWNERAAAQAATAEYERQAAAATAAGKLQNNEFVIRTKQDQAQYDKLVAAQQRAVRYEEQRQSFIITPPAVGLADPYSRAAEEQLKEQTAFFGIPYKLKQANEYVSETAIRKAGMEPEDVYQKMDISKQVFSGIKGPIGLNLQFGSGIVEGYIKEPVTSVAYEGIGYGLGGLFRAIPAIGEATGISKVIIKSQTATKLVAKGSKYFGIGLGGIYAADVGYRTYLEEPSNRISFLGKTTGTEIIPLTHGSVAGYKLADKFIGATRFGDTSRILTAQHIYELPKEQQAAARSTENIFRGIRGVESPLKNEPDLTMVRNLDRGGVKVKDIISKEPHSVFGRTVETGQMPKEWIRGEGTADLDVFVSAPSKTAAKIVKAEPATYSLSPEHPGLVINTKTGQHAVDLHTFPENYPIGKAKEPTISRDIVDSVLDATPKSKKDLLIGDTLTSEKLYVQARRKAASVFGESGKGYGPPEHRLKDVYDMLRYTSYTQPESLKIDFVTAQKYWSDPKVYMQYKHGAEFGPKIKELKWGETPEIVMDIGPGRAISPSISPSALIASYGLSTLAPPKIRSVSPDFDFSTSISEISASKILSSMLPSISPSRSPSPSPSRTPSRSPSPSPSGSIESYFSPSPSGSPSFGYYLSPSPSPSTTTTTIPPIIPEIPLIPGAGGRGFPKSEWDYVFTEMLSGGNIMADVFGMKTKPKHRRKKR